MFYRCESALQYNTISPGINVSGTLAVRMQDVFPGASFHSSEPELNVDFPPHLILNPDNCASNLVRTANY
ncbi:hypothetical protein BD410DRAFT_785512 [Rickenella mellea]|uniref:Uncharacterized protein n=1 Tax=Rickenella mellea TaxID=50990 RepID=A0A4Y7QAV2_9AGAM|nr:hypothetical protein BD410DRAFT_785512 [Rickenella mellea]